MMVNFWMYIFYFSEIQKKVMHDTTTHDRFSFLFFYCCFSKHLRKSKITSTTSIDIRKWIASDGGMYGVGERVAVCWRARHAMSHAARDAREGSPFIQLMLKTIITTTTNLNINLFIFLMVVIVVGESVAGADLRCAQRRPEQRVSFRYFFDIRFSHSVLLQFMIC